MRLSSRSTAFIDRLHLAMPPLGRLLNDRAAGLATVFAMLAPVVFGTMGIAFDFAKQFATRADLQNAADASALAGAKEFRLSGQTPSVVEDIARRVAMGALGATTHDLPSIDVAPSVDVKAQKLTVVIKAVQPTSFMRLLGTDTVEIAVKATAVVLSGPPICVIGLDTNADTTVYLDGQARLEARDCSLYSNSTKPRGIHSLDSSSVRAAFICSAGGHLGYGFKSFVPQPQSDCPVLSDPLAEREQPVAFGCNQLKLHIRAVTTTLMPGTYCGGLSIDGRANVTLSPGVYIFKDGPLRVSGGASLHGDHVGLFFTGRMAVLHLEPLSTVSLTAPKDGLMGGLVIAEDRSTPEGQIHHIFSNDTRMLLGTIYLPRNRLHVGATRPVADQSAYTIVVARYFWLSDGPTMVLNAKYDATDIPVPKGVGPNSDHTALTQ